MTVRRSLIKAVGRTHMAVQRLSGGRALASVAGMPVLLLTTTGRRTGKRRTTPLTFFRDGDDLVVIASNGGCDTPPAWSLNLLARPEASVRIGSAQLAVHARTATPEERGRLWPRITSTYPGYARYEQRTERTIPVFLLTPRGEPIASRP